MKYILVSFLLLTLSFPTCGQGLKELLLQLETAPTDSLTISAYQQLINHYRYSNSDSASYYADKGLSYAREKKYTQGEGIMINTLGQVNERHGLLEVAKVQYLEARSIFMKTQFTKGIAGTTNGLGVIAGKTGEYHEATRHFLDALKLFESINDKHGVVQTYIKLGVVSDHLDNPDEALQYYLKAEVLNDGAPTDNASLTLLNNIGIIYGKRNDISTALKYFHKGLNASDPKRSTGVHIALLGSLGIAYEKSGKPDSALHYQEQALSLARENALPEEEARALVNLASLYRRSDRSKSMELLTTALAITQRIHHLNLMTEVYGSMVDLFKDGGDYKEALVLVEERQLLKDSLLSLQKSKEIANLQALRKVARQENEIKTLAVKNEQSILQRDIMIAIVLVAVAIIGIVWHFNTKISTLNARLLRQQEELKHSNTVKDKLFSILGHDLRAPLTRVIGLLNVLTVNGQAKDEAEIIEKLRNQSRNTLETLDNLLVWGQRQLKGIRLNQQIISAKEQIQTSIALVADYAGQKKISIVDHTPSDLHIFADPSHFDFVMRNLLSNAVKFSHSGTTVAISAFASGIQQVTFAIKDSGVGIAKEMQDHIFTAGTGSLRGTWDEKGTGIGLMLCREYIAENGGRLWLESEPGKGATFFFCLSQKTSAKIAGGHHPAGKGHQVISVPS